MNLNVKGVILKLLKRSTGECLYKPRTRKVSSNRTLKLRKSKKTGQKLKEDIYMYIINKRPVTSLSVLQDNSIEKKKMDKMTRPGISEKGNTGGS